MKPKSSLKCLEEPITSPHSEQEASPHHPTLLLYIQFQPLPSLPRSYKYLLTFMFSDQTLYEFRTSSVHTICPTHLILLYLSLISLVCSTSYEAPHQLNILINYMAA